MTAENILARINAAWKDFQASYVGLSEAEMLEPGVVGKWSVRDVLAHITTWEEETLKALPILKAGERLTRYRDLYGGINAFNALMTERKAPLPLAEVMAQLESTHLQVLAAVAALSDEETTNKTRIYRRLQVDGWDHYPEHTRAIRAWRAKKGI